MPDDRTQLTGMAEIVAEWRGFAVQVGDIIQGRSQDWRALSRLRDAVSRLPVLGGDDPAVCHQLVDLAGRIAVDGDYMVHFDEMNRLKREVLKRCGEAEAGIDILRGMLQAAGGVEQC